jgi:protein-tyrosine phosphatase
MDHDRALNMEDYLKKNSPLKNGVIIRPSANYNKVINYVYLGNFAASKDAEFFKNKKIKAVLNCTKDLPNTFINEKSIEYKRIPIDDSLKEIDFQKMYKSMPKIIEFIDKHVSRKETILVHCFAGRQRSAIAVAAYLVVKRGLSPKQACKFVMEKRPEAFHYGLSLNFSSSLQKFFEDLQKNKNK